MFKDALEDSDTVGEVNVDNNDINTKIIVNSKKHNNILQSYYAYKNTMEINENSFKAIGNLQRYTCDMQLIIFQ